MCNFCTQLIQKGTTENLCTTNSGKLEIFLTAHREDGALTLEVESRSGDQEFWDSISQPILYCPFCGRRWTGRI